MSVARDVEDAHDDSDRAISDASKAIRANPRNADAYCARAANHLARKQTKQALADASRAIELDPEKAAAYHIRGTARFLANQDVAALHDLSEAIGLGPSISDAYYIRGLVRAKRSDFQKAVADFTPTLELDPGATEALLQRAEVYSKLSQFPSAIADYCKRVSWRRSMTVEELSMKQWETTNAQSQTTTRRSVWNPQAVMLSWLGKVVQANGPVRDGYGLAFDRLRSS